jgi:hypothetical protein
MRLPAPVAIKMAQEHLSSGFEFVSFTLPLFSWKYQIEEEPALLITFS